MSISSQVQDWQNHIEYFAGEIGPRGSCTEGERHGHEYAAQTFVRLGLEPCWESFLSATSAYLLYLYVAVAFIAAFLIYPLGGPLSAGIAALVEGVGIYSISMELLYRNNPFRHLLPKAQSQNVYSTLDPAEEHTQDLILIGHVDTNRTPIFFRSATTINLWRAASSIFFFSFLGTVILHIVGAVTRHPLIWPWLSLPGFLSGIGLGALMLEAELSPYTCGANDNATAAGLVLALAEHLQVERLRHTRVWFVCTGCEEVKHYGAIDFFNRHLREFVNPRVMVFEMLGRDVVGYLTKESTISVFTYRAHPEMLEIAQQVCRENPELGGHPTWVDGGHTEMNDARRLGLPAITLIGLNEGGTRWAYDGPVQYWHHREDTCDKMDPTVLTCNYTFARKMITAIDERGRSGSALSIAQPADQSA
jgi:hypothetical protein